MKFEFTQLAQRLRAWAQLAKDRAMQLHLPDFGLRNWTASDSITIEEGDTDTAPYGLGTYGSRSTPVAGAATAMVAGKSVRRHR